MENFYKKHYETIIKTTIILGILAFLFLIPYIFYLFTPFILGYIISKLLRPILNFYTSKLKLSTSVSAVISILTFFIITFLIFKGLYNVIGSQIGDLTEHMPDILEEATKYYNIFKDFLYERILIPSFILDTFSITFESIMTIITNAFAEFSGNVAKNIITALPTIFMNIIIGFISSFFFLKDNELIKKSFKKYTPTLVKKSLTLLRDKIGFALIAYIKAQSILMCMTTTIVFIGLLILRINYSFVIALIIGFIDAIPIFGSGFVLYPLVVYNLLIGNYMRALGLGIIYCVVFLNRQIFEPKILGVQIGLPPLLTLMSVYIGFKLFGILGLILGPVTFIVINTVITSNIREL